MKKLGLAVAALTLVLMLLGVFYAPGTQAQSAFETFYCSSIVTRQIGDMIEVDCYPVGDPTPEPPTPTPEPPTPTPEPPTPTPEPPVSGGLKIVGKDEIALFDQIPAQYLEAAKNTTMVFSDRSVGDNINQYLNCLAAPTYGSAPAFCRKDYAADGSVKLYTQADYDAGLVPAEIMFTPGAQYDRSNWSFEFRTGDWSQLTNDFLATIVPQYLGSKDLLTYQFSYLNVNTGSSIIRYFEDSPTRGDIYDIERYLAQNPDKKFFYWTTSLARIIGTPESKAFNEAMRQYAIDNDKFLLDVAEIESFTPSGEECLLNGNPVICQDYTTEVNGGHLGSVSAGGIRIAKAMWVMMALQAGWVP